MRVICSGSRDWTDRAAVVRELACLIEEFGPDVTVVHGDCRGADRIAAAEARTLGLAVEAFPADWVKYGRAAGPIRNQQMLNSGVDLVICFHSDLFQGSRGTLDMYTRAQRIGTPIRVVPS